MPDATVKDRAVTPSWNQPREHGLVTLARNVSTRYVLTIVNVLIGLWMLRYNVQHLGSSAYGLWMLAASVATYFTAFDFGYGSAVVKFVAEFRAKRDARALNEILSTMACVYTAIGAACYAAAIVIAAFLPYIFNLEPGHEQTGRLVLLIIAMQVALYFPFAVYGGLVNGFERFYLNNVVGLIVNVLTAGVNVLVLWLGYGLVELVLATTIMRIAPLWLYRRNAHTVFPELELRLDYVRRDRLRDLSGFSVYVAVVDWAGRLTHATASFYLGIFVNTVAVGIYAVAQRVAEALFDLTNQIHTFLMPAVVHRAIDGDTDRQQSLMLRATRFQLAIAICLCGGVAAVADALIRNWLGAGWSASVPVLQLLCLAVVLRALLAMPVTVLLGTGHHKYVAVASGWCAVGNLVLSVPLVKMWGAVGVTLGMVVAVTAYAMVVFPKACRVVQLPVGLGLRQIVWPALWPAVLVMAALAGTRNALPAGLVPLLAHLAFGGVMYGGLFLLFGLDADERHWVLFAFNRISGRDARRPAVDQAVG